MQGTSVFVSPCSIYYCWNDISRFAGMILSSSIYVNVHWPATMQVRCCQFRFWCTYSVQLCTSEEGWCIVCYSSQLHLMQISHNWGQGKTCFYCNLELRGRRNSVWLFKCNCVEDVCFLWSCHWLDWIQVATAEGVEDGTQGDALIECPLCHTKFCLENGKVAEFCPRDGPLAWAIGTLKSKEEPVDAKVCRMTIPVLVYLNLFFIHFDEFTYGISISKIKLVLHLYNQKLQCMFFLMIKNQNVHVCLQIFLFYI